MAASRRAALAVTGIVSGAGLLVGLAMSPALAGSAPAAALAGGCTATGHIDSQWGSGEILTVTVANTSASAATAWTATWTLAAGQHVVSAWNATVSTSGASVTAVNATWNGSLAAEATTTFGLQLSGPPSTPAVTCGTNAVPLTGPASASASPTTSAPPVTGAQVTVTQADNGRTIALHVGDGLVVHLASNYQPPRIRTAGVVAQGTVTGGYPTGQPLVAQYVATAPGTTDVTTITDAACVHSATPCPTPQIPWTVHVTVTA